MEENINLFLQSYSNDFLDWLNLAFTQLGGEIFFLAVAMVLFWCVDKKFGFKTINVYLIGCIAMSGMKNIVRRPRPFENGNVRSIGAKESGYSFPSGHSHSAVNLSAQAALKTRKISVIVYGAVLTAVVMFTRLYLGQHYITDVIAGCALGIIVAVLFSWLYGFIEDKEDKIWYVITPLCIGVAIICAALGVESGQIYDVCGGYGAAAVAYALEKKYIALDVKTDFKKQIAKILIGAVSVLAVKEGLKVLFSAIGWTHALAYNFLRYALVVATAFVLMPWIYKKLHLYGRSGVNELKEKSGRKNETAYR